MEKYIVAIKIFIVLLAATLFVSGNLLVFIFSYLIVFFLMVIRTIVVPAERKIRAYLIITYAAITVAQIFFNSAVTFAQSTSESVLKFLLCKLFSIALLLFPFIIERFVTINKYAKFYMPSATELSVISFSEIKSRTHRVNNTLRVLDKAGRTLSSENIKEITSDIPRHNSFEYINKKSLSEEYFDLAYLSLEDSNIYIVISNTGSPASEIISLFTQKQYNHASISFDQDLKTIISYNGGERVYTPGLNHEMIEFFNKKPDASIIIYRLECSLEQKKLIIDKVKEINDEGNAYNMMGLILKYSHKPNIMFCSQFVYKMLEYSGLAYFEKNDGEVKPTDLVELDYYRKLDFVYEIKF